MLSFWRVCAITSAFWLLVLYAVLDGKVWTHVYRPISDERPLLENFEDANEIQPIEQSEDSTPQAKDGNDWRRLFPIEETHSEGLNFSRTLVVASLANESTTWIQEELADLLTPIGPLSTAVYVADNKSAPLHPPRNKGHETNIYLNYIIDEYDSLPDVAIFVHAHQATWHNNDLLGHDTALTVRNISPAQVISRGYVNLRCHWDPGCPDWIHTENKEEDDFKQEEHIIANAWHELFPEDPVPSVLAQPCCAQFAVSGERIRKLTRKRYIQLRDWIYETDYPDSVAGRVFEYVWQYIFTSSAKYCPDTALCYCDLYGVCFEDGNDFAYWEKARQEISDINDTIEDDDEESSGKDGCDGEECRDEARDALLKRRAELEADQTIRAYVAFSAGRRIRGLS